MSDSDKWRIAHLRANDTKSHDVFVSQFKQAYQASGKPDGMAMFSHTDSFGALMAVSITSQSVPYCPFSDDWSEPGNPPTDFGNLGWVAGDVRLK